MELFWEAVLLGLLQGLTEFLPISSSGHLALGEKALGWDEPGMAFDVAVHVGSLGAVLVFVRREIVAMLTRQPRLLGLLVVATVPAAVAGLGGAADVVDALKRNLAAVGLCLLGTAGILAVARKLPDRQGTAAQMGWGKALLVGLAQVLALLPGVSRSGSTFTAGLGVGLGREEAIRFAFLMAVPAIGGAAVLTFAGGDFGTLPHGALAGGTVVSFVASLFAMKAMVAVVVRRKLGWFALYCAALGLTAIGFHFM
mgnify:CR=1 FL=1